MNFITYTQSFASPALDIFFQAVTMLGEDSILILGAAIVYWCYDKRLGFWLGALYSLSMITNNVIKEIAKAPRPIGIEGIRSIRLETASGYSFPSGHTQGITTFLTALAQSFNRRWLYALSVLIIILVGFSRIYLGVHFPGDVLWGAVIGISVTLLAGPALASFLERKSVRPSIYLLLTAVIAATMYFVTAEDAYKACGAMAGLFAGRHLEERFINFEAYGSILFNTVKIITGITVLIAIKEGLKAVLPDVLFSQFIRYMAVGIWAAAGAPWCFTLLARIRGSR